jgi:trehalose 6-phosphate phosphatase
MTDAGGELDEQAARLAARAGQVALCLDFDGTLSPIVPDPEAARPVEGVVELLGRLAARFAAVALVSGRPADYLAEHAAAPGVRYLGLYGLQEIRDGQVRVDQRLEAGRPAVEAAQQDLRDHPAVGDSGAWLEDKRYAVAVHTRRVADPDCWAGRSTSPPARSPPGTAWRWSRASWSGSCARRCPGQGRRRPQGGRLLRRPLGDGGR